MNPSSPNTTANSGEGAGPGSASNMNATPIQAFNPPAMQTLQQVVLDGVSVSDVHGLSATSQHAGHAHDNGLGIQPPQMFPGLVAATQMKQFVEQGEPAQGNHERTEWSGTITWWGTDTTRNETRELQAQITATASKGDPLVSTWPDALLLAPAGPAVSMDELDDWIRKNDPVVMDIRPTSEMDPDGYGQLVKLLGYKSCYAMAGWEIPGKGHSMNLFIALSTTQGLIGAAFPTTGIPDIPKPQLTRLVHAVHSVGGNSTGINPRATLKTAGGIDKRITRQWSGTLTWQGTNATLGERREVRAQVTACATKGDPWVSTWPNVLSLAPAGPAVSMAELQDWMMKYSPVVTHIEPTGTNGQDCGQLVKLLRDKSCYAVSGWKIPGMTHSTMNLLIAPYSQGLLGAVFPLTGIPEIPKPRPPQLDPAVRRTIFSLLSLPIQSLPEPQLSQAIMEIFLSQKHGFNAMQGAVCTLT